MLAQGARFIVGQGVAVSVRRVIVGAEIGESLFGHNRIAACVQLVARRYNSGYTRHYEALRLLTTNASSSETRSWMARVLCLLLRSADNAEDFRVQLAPARARPKQRTCASVSVYISIGILYTIGKIDISSNVRLYLQSSVCAMAPSRRKKVDHFQREESNNSNTVFGFDEI